jgi:hypothetical protein
MKPFLRILALLNLCFCACKHYPNPIIPNKSLNANPILVDYDGEPLNCTECTEVASPPNDLIITQIDYQQTPPYIRGFSINPQNNAEIVYTKIVFGQVKMNTFIFNWKTNANRLLDEGIIIGCPRWHSNDWILLPKQGRVCKIKSNGDSLSSILSYASNTGSSWNQAGDKIAFYPYSDNQSVVHFADMKGRITDSLMGEPAYDSYFDWGQINRFTRQRVDGSIIDMNTHTRMRQMLVESQGTPNGFCWLNDQKTMIVATNQGLFITDTFTKKIKKIRCSCASVYYQYPIYAEKYHKIFAIKAVVNSVNPPFNTQIMTCKKIVMMNVDGTHEEVIEIPK